VTSESRRGLAKTFHLATGEAECRAVHDRFIPDVEVVEAGRAVDREPILTGSMTPIVQPCLGVRAERAEASDRSASVDGIGETSATPP